MSAPRTLFDTLTATELAVAAATAARTILDSLQLTDTAAAAAGVPFVDVTVIKVAGRQRRVDVRESRGRAVTIVSRPRRTIT